MKTQKFNMEDYQKSLNIEIEEKKAELATLEANRSMNFWQIRNLRDKIERLTLRLDPKFVCEYCYSDRHAYEVLRMETAKRMVVRRLNPRRVDTGHYMSDAQAYEFDQNTQAPEVTLRLHKNGLWYETDNCNPFGITAEPHEHFDFSF